MDTQEFIKKAKALHGDRFDYSESVYHYRNPIKIICKDHGPFYQRYDHHIHPNRRGGCRKCYASSSMLTEQQALDKLISVHGDRFDYSKFSYSGARGKIIVICKTHGEYLTTFANHALGKGCRKCANSIASSSTNEFIEKSRQIHGDAYIYEKTVYRASADYVCITCRTHGDFFKTPDNHLHKTKPQGCPKCNEYTGFNRESAGYLYSLISGCGRFMKVGISNNPNKRFKVLAKKTPFEFRHYSSILFEKGRDAEKMERFIHKNFASANFRNFDGATEWLLCSRELLGVFSK